MLTFNSALPVTDEIPGRFRTASLAQVANGQSEVAWAINDALRQGRGVILRGPTGTGKTHALAAIAREIAPEFPRPGTGFIEWPEFCNDVRRWYGLSGPDKTAVDPMRWIRYTTKPLFIDDVGEIGRTDPSHDDGLFAEVVREVYRHGNRSLFLTTNLGVKAGVDELASRFGERCWSRLQQLCAVVEVLGDDLRSKLPHRVTLASVKGIS